MPKRHYFTVEKTKVGDASVELDIEFGKVPEGKEYHYISVASVNQTTNYATVKFGILKGGQKIWLAEETNCTATVTYCNSRRPAYSRLVQRRRSR
jgi:hypothetical protein